MILHLGTVDANSTLYIPFHTFNSSGASVTITGLATTDIEVYKNGSTTQRASDNGYALLDTDGIDFDGITGIHGISIDLSDNTDAGFYASGSFYWVVISSITVDSQTVNFVAATFRIGTVAANVTHYGGTAGTFASGRPEVNTSHIAGSAVSTSSAQIGVNVINAAGTAWNSGAIGASTLAADTITAAKIADGAIDANTFATGAITATAIAADAIGASELAADAVTEIQSGLATSASIAALNNLSAAQVNAEVVDALAIDTYAEPGQGAPAATTTLAAKINYLYKSWRNKKDQTASLFQLYADDATTVDQKASVSSDGTTTTIGEIATGP